MKNNAKLWIYVALLVMTIVAMVMLKHCARTVNVAVQRASGGDTIDVAIEYSPISFYAIADTIGGFNYDVLRLLANRHSLAMKFHPLVSLSAGLKSGAYDIVAAQFPVTESNKEQYLFTHPIYIDRQVLVQRRDSTGAVTVKSQLDLAGKHVSVVAGSPMKQRVENLSREIGDTIYVDIDTEYGPEQLMIMVATGDIDFAVINESIAGRMIKRYPLLDISTAISFSQFQALTLRKTDVALCDSLNLWIDRVKQSPEYARLKKRYF